MRAGVVDHQQVADLGFGQHAVHGEFVVVFAQAPRHIHQLVMRQVLLAGNGDVVIRAVHGGAHQVAGAGVQAQVVLVDALFVDDMRHQPAVGAGHVAAQLGLDGHAADAVFGEGAAVLARHALAHGADIGFGLIGPVGNADAARQVDKGQRHAALVHQLAAGLKQEPCQGGIIGGVGGIAAEEGVQAEAHGPQVPEAQKRLRQLRARHAVLGVAGVAHDGVADAEGAAGIEAQAHRFRHAAVLRQRVHMGDVVQVDVRAQPPGEGELVPGHVVGAEHDVPALKSAGVGQHQLGGAGAVHPAALLLEDAQNGGGGQGLDRKVLAEILDFAKGVLERARGLANAALAIEMKRRGKLACRLENHLILQGKIRHGNILLAAPAALWKRSYCNTPPARGQRQISPASALFLDKNPRRHWRIRALYAMICHRINRRKERVLMETNKRPDSMARINTPELAQAFIDEQVAALRAQVGDRKVLLALSGGVDSSVVAALLIRAIGRQLVCVHVNHGLMRKGESEQVVEVFRNQLGANLIYVDAVDRFLTRLEGVSDPEQKRKIIGAEFIRVFEEEARKLQGIEFLAQGTIYPDIVESHGVKAHHNVGGLPDDLKFDLVEPLRLLFKDEVRQVGAALGLPDSMVYRQPFPGPGLGVRCLGAITRDRLAALRESDAILREEFDRAGLTSQVWQFFTIVPDMRSTGVRDGARVFDWPVIIRAVNTVDAMTATVPELPWALLKRVTDRVLSEVPGVCRVLYDLSPKPVGTNEWE